ncbi:MAG: DUF4956 domain-containing protein [Planctomycetes bacterium]|nr:DUF4956 domain-containing protein [Planctomycetota bacterium]NBY02111.1 DUF4956 domain-containing protein [Planctomycetota bacterium]
MNDLENNLTEQAVFFGGTRLTEFGFRFALNAIVIFLLVRIIYYPRHRNKDFLFSFFLFNIINFIICYLLSSATIKIGFAFGLFAIFSIIRYRSVSVPIREMAYLLTSVTIGILNALSSLDTGLPELLISNGVLLLLTFVLDRKVTLPHENSQTVIYEKIDLIRPENRSQLIEDLKQRTGLPIHRIEIGRIDLMRDSAKIRIFYLSQESQSSSFDSDGDDD